MRSGSRFRAHALDLRLLLRVARLVALLSFCFGVSLSYSAEPVAAATKTDPPTDRGAPAARLLPQEFASEHWELTARFDSGHFLFVHFLITNIGWGDRNAVVIGHIVAPDGRIHRFDNARREAHWRLSPDRLQLEVGPNTLDFHDPRHQLLVNKKSVRLALHFRSDGPTIRSEALARSGYALDLVAAAVPVDGVLWTKGMTDALTVHGTLAVTHSWMKEGGAALVRRRLEFFALQEDFPLYGVDLTAPDGAHVRWLVIKRQEAKAFESETFALSTEKELAPPKDPGYLVPTAFQFKDAALNGRVRLERTALWYDPFAPLPKPLRFLASMTLNLHPRLLWADSPFDITIQPDQTPAALQSDRSSALAERRGAGVTAITFLNPFPDAQRTERQRETERPNRQ